MLVSPDLLENIFWYKICAGCWLISSDSYYIHYSTIAIGYSVLLLEESVCRVVVDSNGGDVLTTHHVYILATCNPR